MMTSKERAEFRAKANTLDTTLIVGKNGVTDALIEEVNILLDTHELVKGKVLESALLSAREVSDAICEATGADGIQVVGTKFVIYRFSQKLEQERKEKAKAEKKKKVDPSRAGAQARRKAAKEEKERRDKFFHDEAVKAAIERRKNGAKR